MCADKPILPKIGASMESIGHAPLFLKSSSLCPGR